jgi:PAS domain S-box-containing protein
LSNAVPLFDERGKPRGAVGVSIDLTELKQTEKALRESEIRFRMVYERSPVGIALVDSQTGRFLQVNSKFCEITGRNEQDLLQSDLAAITHPDDIGPTNKYLRDLDEEAPSKPGLEKRYLRPDGSVRWVKVLAVPMWSKGDTRRWHMGLVEDITERKKSEESIARLMQEVCDGKKKLAEEKLYLEQEINTELGYGEIVGRSKALQAVMENVTRVASSDATVLLLGETGTGKELIARAIHRASQRANTSFIKMNCAAIPSGLLESELFGNEKGAFTGAVSKKIGRLELADKGTLFLDEIGDISLTLQPKLLRVLQDQEFERLGGTQTLKVNFRLIAATNVDLGQAVREKEFRSDLYYRLNVFPIHIPPLRERREDIHLLVRHFVSKCARRMNKSITSIPKKTMDALVGWDWPGNVRELENFVERSVILTRGSVLVAPLSEMRPASTGAGAKKEVANKIDETLKTTETEHILRALRESRGQIGGPRGAAMRLGLKRTTLQSKLKHLNIDPRSKFPSH